MSIWRWKERWSHIAPEHRITLGEGNTPLVHSRRIGPSVGLKNLFFKLESVNPSGSYKDRFAAVAVAEMLAQGKTRCLATSSGNTGSALAAYCAAAGISCEIALVETTPSGKLRQMSAYGARLFRVRGFGLDPHITKSTFGTLREFAQQPDAALQISAFHFSPAGMSGCETISLELPEQMPERPDHVFCPAGGGGLTLAVARGFEQLSSNKVRTRIECVQPEGNDTIVTPLRTGLTEGRVVSCTTSISGLQVPDVFDADGVIRACRASGGTGHLVTDEDAWTCQVRLACEEGVFCEPAGAVALAGALRAREDGYIDEDARIVCLVTGTGFKDPVSLDRMCAGMDCPMIELDAMPEWLRRSHK